VHGRFSGWFTEMPHLEWFLIRPDLRRWPKLSPAEVIGIPPSRSSHSLVITGSLASPR
jgi:hypothetical protein